MTRPAGQALGPGQWRVTPNGGEPVVVNVPVLAAIASDSARIIAKASSAGQLGALAREIAAIDAISKGSRAAEYERKAYEVSDPQLRKGYLELAAQERQRVSAP